MLTEQQLKERKSGIGGSDAAAAVGMNPYKSPVRLWMEKTGRVEPENLDTMENVQIGSEIEDFIARLWSDRTETKVRRDDTTKTRRHAKHKHMLCHVDRNVLNQERKTIMEVKNVDVRGTFTRSGEPVKWGKQGELIVPDYYYIQCLHNSVVVDAEICVLVALIGGNNLRWYDIEINPEEGANLIEAEQDFWKHVVNDTPPPEESAADTELLYASEVKLDDAVVADLDGKDAWRMAMRARSDLKVAQGGKEYADWLLKQALRANTLLVDEYNEPMATWKQNKESKKTDWQAMFRKLAEETTEDEKAAAKLLRSFKSEFTTTSPGNRPLLIKEPK